MDIAALVTWIIMALGGFALLGVWISRGGPRSGTSRLPVPVVVAHGLFAVATVVLVLLTALGVGATPACPPIRRGAVLKLSSTTVLAGRGCFHVFGG
ncbi:hypothetical protein [Microbispora sp. CA-102843]|uniref:hypothetical protein n=1 Tax=Microbispora sp. CA-102843 TaxID=3239952 RepID=UPI003D8E5452